MRLSGWVTSSVSLACSVLPHLTLPPPRPFSKTCVLCLMVYWFLPGQQSLPLSSPSVKALFPTRSPVTPPPSQGFHISNSLPTVGSVRAGSTHESSGYLAQPSGTQEILESMKRWVNEGFAHLPQPVLSVRSWGWDPFVPLSILQIMILPPLISASHFEAHATWLKPTTPSLPAAVLTSVSLVLKALLSDSCLSAMPSLEWLQCPQRWCTQHSSFLVPWPLQYQWPSSSLFCNCLCFWIHPGTHCHLEWCHVQHFFPHGCKFPEADFKSSLHFFF